MARTFVFAGGGSGGHIYPGLAIAEEMRRLSADTPPRIVFVCSSRPLDATILTTAGESFIPSPAQPLYARPSGLWRFVLGWRKAMRQNCTTLRELQTSARTARLDTGVHVVAMGGFVAAPMIAAARKLGLPTTMVNLDAVPGKANRWLGRRVDRVFTAARVLPGSARAASWVQVPPIVRAGARTTLSPEECRRSLSIPDGHRVLVVTGGSQGLRSLNDFLVAFAGSPRGKQALNDRWTILHQTGRKFEDAVRAAYQSAGVHASVHAFSDAMGLWWGAADAAVCTAGAGNVAEIWVNRVPALLLPFPHHKDEHQKHNAAPLTECSGSILGVDLIEPAQNITRNGPALLELLTSDEHRKQLRLNLNKLGPADGATRIARALLDA
ncbi:MAG: UDP-N-acetylglucosamine--N-acetylmuramyl-(pentapeptide) pyrophosphoryl-undecaprenol N-acetylglucosamine transferase [Phycisphaerales bacterium]|nr:UDP-N-acetylglucosamine--N-acetylmuramyl-(pentapeptide) pyrophosphoryl-undecaprenol N-acetylglucosamine transferase [Phycisphaerales bacterium]